MRKAFLATVVALALTGAACSSSGGDSGGSCTSDNASALTGTLTIVGFAFSPNCFSVQSGASISVENKDGMPHTFTVDSADVAVDVKLSPGASGSGTAPAAGTYGFHCSIHPAMTGTMIVT